VAIVVSVMTAGRQESAAARTGSVRRRIRCQPPIRIAPAGPVASVPSRRRSFHPPCRHTRT
jgi:hypothetical protein